MISQSEKPSYPVSWYEASDPKTGPWVEHVIGYFDYCHTLKAGDMDYDGDIDVVIGKFERSEPPFNPPPYPLKVCYNVNGDGLSWSVTEVSDLGIYTGVIGDIGNDGDLDIVGSRSYWRGPIEIWENTIDTVYPRAHGAISVAFDDGKQSEYDYAFPLMQARGVVGTFYVVSDFISDFSNNSSFMSIAELQILQDYGCEIASHSKSHLAFTQISDSQIREECNVSKRVLQSYGFSAENFAYPYGDRNSHTDSIVAEYYRSGRSAYEWPYIMELPISQFLLAGCPGETGTPDVLSYLERVVDEVYSTNGWAIIYFHDVIPGANNEDYTISAEDFESFLDYVIYKGVPTITVSQGLDLVHPPSSSPSVSISPTSVRMYVGQLQMFSSSVTGGNAPFSYQWYLNGSAVSGATNSSWVFTPETAGAYEVYLNVTDGLNFEVQSNIVSDITVYSQLSVSISPVSVNMAVGGSQTFSSSISGGAPPYSYEWYLNGTVVSGAVGSSWNFVPEKTRTYLIQLGVADSFTAVVQSNIAVAHVMSVSIAPTEVKMYVGQSQVFSASVSGGSLPYIYQWFLNDTAVSGATGSCWTFTPKSEGRYRVYVNVTDTAGCKIQSNDAEVLACTVYLLMPVDSSGGRIAAGQPATVTVNVFNNLDPVFESSLTLTVTGPRDYGYFDVQPIRLPAGTVGEYSFTWAVPYVAGTYVVEVSLVPAQLTAYDAVWLKVT